MFFSETDLSDFIEENDVKFIRMTFCDTFGNMKNIAIMPRELHRAITDGIPFNATGLPGGIPSEPASETGHLHPVHPALAAPVGTCGPLFLQAVSHGRHTL